MRSTRIASIAAALLIGAAAAPLAARTPVVPICQPVLAIAESVWIAEKEIEVGEISGLLNGGFFLDFDDANTGSDPSIGPNGGPSIQPMTPPNLVIATKAGTLEVWLSGDSVLDQNGSWTRKLSALQIQGSGDFTGASAELALSGRFYPEKGGAYQLSGSICAPAKKPTRR